MLSPVLICKNNYSNLLDYIVHDWAPSGFVNLHTNYLSFDFNKDIERTKGVALNFIVSYSCCAPVWRLVELIIVIVWMHLQSGRRKIWFLNQICHFDLLKLANYFFLNFSASLLQWRFPLIGKIKAKCLMQERNERNGDTRLGLGRRIKREKWPRLFFELILFFTLLLLIANKRWRKTPCGYCERNSFIQLVIS